MSKLSATLISASLIASASFANEVSTEDKVIKFLKSNLSRNPSIVSIDVSVINKIPVDQPKGWDAYIISIDGQVKMDGAVRNVKQQKIYFASGDVLAQQLIDLKTGRPLNDSISPEFKPEFYDKANLIYGNADAKHKVAIFSDPLCPFCRRYVPEAISYMKRQPETFAVYYYHFPLPTLHPAAVALTKAAIAAEHKGHEDVLADLYKVNVNARETDEQKIVDAFNATLGTKITVADIHTEAVEKAYKRDQNIAMQMMVNGTPTVFFDGKKDSDKMQYKQVKGKQ
jgi:protein-disulfide isomerase